ncbi:unnamed protein product [Musa acuminata subsp. burmannicoides]
MLVPPARAPTTNDTLRHLSLSLPSAPSRLRGRHRRPRPNFTGMPFLLGGFGCVCIIFFSLTGSIYFVLNQLQQQPEDRLLHPDDGSLNRPDSPSIVIFAAPRRFSTDKPDLVGARQDMAVRSWLALSPDVSVVLFGQHPSIFALARSLGPRVTVESAIDFTFMGTPFFHSMVSRSQAFNSGISVLIDPETILLPDFLGILHYSQNLNHGWFLFAKPHCVLHFPFQLLGTGKQWLQEDGEVIEVEKLQEHLIQKGNWSTCGERLLMAWNNGVQPLHAGIVPPFVYGEGLHNEWLVNEVLASDLRFAFDSSLVLSSLYPQSLGQWFSNFSKDAGSADELVWRHRGNYQLSALYGSFSFQQSKFCKNPSKLVRCSGKYYLINRVEDDVSSLQVSDGIATYSTDPHLSSREQKSHMFTIFSRSQRDKKWKACVNNIDALDLSYQHIVKKLNEDNSEVSSALSLPFSIELLLRIIADEDKSIVLAIAGNNYRDMLMNWVCRLRHLAVKNFVICALDSEIYHFSILQGLPVFKNPQAPTNISFNDCHFGTECFRRVTKVKSRIVLQILKLGYNVLMSDVDVYWFNNPLSFLVSFGPGTLVAQSDEYNETGPINLPRRLNSGFYFARSEMSTIAAFEMVVKHASASELSEQPSFYDVLCGEGGVNRMGDDKCQEPNTNLTVIFLDRNLFPNGAYRGLWEKHDVRSSCMKLGCLILHNNWISGRKKKLERQVFSGLWDYDPSLRMCLQKWQIPNQLIFLDH